jgi:hypothetical protein
MSPQYLLFTDDVLAVVVRHRATFLFACHTLRHFFSVSTASYSLQ